jgi:hypothetical protein
MFQIQKLADCINPSVFWSVDSVYNLIIFIIIIVCAVKVFGKLQVLFQIAIKGFISHLFRMLLLSNKKKINIHFLFKKENTLFEHYVPSTSTMLAK